MELAVLHDRQDIVAILEQRQVLQRIAVDQQGIGQKARADLAELVAAEGLAAIGGGGAQHFPRLEAEEIDENATDEAETAPADAEETEESEPAAAPSEVTAETAEAEATPEPATKAAPVKDSTEAPDATADEGDESKAKLRNRRPTGKGSHRMRRRRTEAGVALDENADEN